MERSNESPTDKELLDDFVREGCEASFNELLQRYKLRLFNLAFRVLYDRHAAEDVVQSVFVRLAKGKGELSNVQSPRSWLYVTALNLSLDMQKRKQRRKKREMAGANSSMPETPREVATRAELRKELDAALAALKTSLRIPLVLRYLHGLSYAESAGVMDVKADTIRKRVKQGLRAMRKLLAARGCVIPVVAIEAGLKTIPAEAVSAGFLTSASSVLNVASAGGTAVEAATTSTSVITGVTIMTAKAKIAIGAVVFIAAAFLFVCLRGLRTDKGAPPSRKPMVSKRAGEREASVSVSAPPSHEEEMPAPVARAKGVAVIASSEMVERRTVDFSSMVNAIWDAHMGTIFASGDGEEKVNVPAGLEVGTLRKALSSCQICLLLWDEHIREDVLTELKQYCRTGGWLMFVSCPWIGGALRSSPAELLGLRDFQGVADVRSLTGRAERPVAVALFPHPSIPTLSVRKQIGLNRPSFRTLSGGQGGSIPLIHFESPALRGASIQAVGHGGIIEFNWDCPAGGSIGDVESLSFIRASLRWLAAKENWKKPTIQSGVSLEVLARNPEGEPVPGSRVTVTVYTDWARPVGQQVLTAGDNGECLLMAEAPAVYSAQAVGQRQTSDTLVFARVEEGRTPQPLVVIVRPILRIVGTVTYADEEANPASGAEVDLLPSSRARGMVAQTRTTDEEGRFTFEQVPGGRSYLLRCELDEWGSLAEIDLPQSAENETYEVNLSLKKLVAIDGRVVEEGEEQKPVEGATVHVRPCWGIKGVDLFLEPLRKKFPATDSEGRFKLPVVPGILYGVRAEAPGYVWPWIRLGLGRYERWVEVQPPATVTLKLRPGTVVKGIVYFPGGQPAPQAWVMLGATHVQQMDAGRFQRTDADGRFSFTCTQFPTSEDRKEKRVAVFACSGRFGGYASSTVAVEQTEIEVVVNLEEQALIQGIVTDLQERPLANVAVYSPWTTDVPPADHSDQNGLFEVPIRGQLWVVKEGYAPKLVGYEELQTLAQENRLLRIALPRRDGRVAGRVIFHDGTPLRNEMVGIWAENEAIPRLLRWQRNVLLGDDGEFELEDISVEGNKFELFDAPVETVDVQVNWYPDRKSRDARASATAEDVPLGATDVVVRFPPFAELRGRFVDAEKNVGVADVSVTLIKSGVLSKLTANSSGEFRHPWMNPGEYRFWARPRGFFPLEKTIQAGVESVDLGDLSLYRSLTIAGQAVYGGSGIPVEAGEIAVRAIGFVGGPKGCGRGVTDSRGHFQVALNNPFEGADPNTVYTFRMMLEVRRESAYGSREFDSTQAVSPGTIDLGRIEVAVPEGI